MATSRSHASARSVAAGRAVFLFKGNRNVEVLVPERDQRTHTKDNIAGIRQWLDEGNADRIRARHDLSHAIHVFLNIRVQDRDRGVRFSILECLDLKLQVRSLIFPGVIQEIEVRDKGVLPLIILPDLAANIPERTSKTILDRLNAVNR